MKSTLSDAMQPYLDRSLFAGAVMAVADRDGTRSVESIGMADLSGNVPMRNDSLFWIASITKPITATAFMMLVDEGKVRVEDRVKDYLPEFQDLLVQASDDAEPRPPSRPIVLRDLLAHTSGLPFGAPEESPCRDQLSCGDSIALYTKLRLKDDPGKGYVYSNAGINTIGRIIELASGQTYEDFLQSRILDPLGMRDTCFRPDAGQIARLAKSYKPAGDTGELQEIQIDQLTYPLDLPARQAMAAGGLFSGAEDLIRFGRMILRGGELDGHRYISESAHNVMTTKQTGDLAQSYGLGWSVNTTGYSHGGAYRTDLAIDTSGGIVRVFLIQIAADWSNNEHGLQVIPAFAQAALNLVPAGA